MKYRGTIQIRLGYSKPEIRQLSWVSYVAQNDLNSITIITTIITITTIHLTI
jgi:hypothetical protein